MLRIRCPILIHDLKWIKSKQYIVLACIDHLSHVIYVCESHAYGSYTCVMSKILPSWIEVKILNQFLLGGGGLGKFQTITDPPASIVGWSIENIGGFNTQIGRVTNIYLIKLNLL